MEVKASLTSHTDSVEDLKLDTLASTSSTASTVYHIYHTGKGKRPKDYSIHSIRDSETTVLPLVKTSKSSKKGRKSSLTVLEATNSKTGVQVKTTEFDAPDGAALQPTESIPLKGFKKLVRLDNPKCDPRSETAPYFVKLPVLAGHEPPYSLRYGGHKKGDVACLLHGSLLWRNWKLEFGDMLQQEGVVDGRGVINAKYGTKDGKGGYFKGYKVGKRRWWGESGKQYFNEQKELGFPDNIESEGMEKLKPDEVVKLVWNSPFSLRTRHHTFQWRGFEFVWKGTKKVESRTAAKAFVWCSHLKLVVLLQEDEAKKEICLAKYSCVMGQRKAGRLEVYQDVIDVFLGEYVLKDEQSGAAEDGSSETQVVDAVGLGENAKAQQRLKDVVIGTSICMIMTEREKRRFLFELLQLIAENAG